MSNKESLYKEQKKSKPKVEDIINDSLKNDNLRNALEFVDYVKSFRMTPQWASANSWAVNYKGKRVCYIKVSANGTGDGAWYIRPAVRYNEVKNFCTHESLEEVMLDNIHFCGACGRCAPGKHETFFGKEFDNVCCAPIDFEFHNPNTETLNCAKKLVEFKRSAIADFGE